MLLLNVDASSPHIHRGREPPETARGNGDGGDGNRGQILKHWLFAHPCEVAVASNKLLNQHMKSNQLLNQEFMVGIFEVDLLGRVLAFAF